MRTKRQKRQMAWLLTGALLVSLLIPVKPIMAAQTSAILESQKVESTTGDMKAQEAKGIQVAYHTQEEIREYLEAHKVDLKNRNHPILFSEESSYEEPWAIGKLADETQKEGLELINAIRFIAGLSYDVEVKDEYIELAQASSYINALNESLSHYHQKPEGVPDEIYDKGYEGSSHSNISSYWASNSQRNSLSNTMIDGWMADDSSETNLSCVGHRRWILYPGMKYTGFGIAIKDKWTFSAMYSFDQSRTEKADEYGVCWPAQNMPTECFAAGMPWSISMGKNVNKDTVSVTLKRNSDGKTWNFSKESADGKLYINNQGYGQVGCIIFIPSDVDAY